jgi:hypothetical protein
LGRERGGERENGEEGQGKGAAEHPVRLPGKGGSRHTMNVVDCADFLGLWRKGAKGWRGRGAERTRTIRRTRKRKIGRM